jgi:sensor histidine kinase YesM
MGDLGKGVATWLVNYKIHHLPFWFAYHYLWWSLITGSLVEPAYYLFNTPSAFKFLFYVIFQAIGVYFNLYFLIPAFLEKGKYAMYVVLVLITIVVTAMLIVPGYYVSAWVSEKTFQEMYKMDPNFYQLFKNNSLASSAASMTLAMSIKLTKNWIQSKRRQQELEKEKLETELKFLRSQFNPHFLFNTINSIFFLIHKNPVLASNALAKFSDLLRFQLYECNETQIPLSNELSYLENFIELQKLRQSKNVEVTIRTDSQPKQHLGIAPFMLITFTENAFKHLSDHADKPNWIKINLALSGSALSFSIINSVKDIKEKEVVTYGGLGLKNIKRRLDLIYPGNYELNIEPGGDKFEVQLRLKLSELSEPQLQPIHKTA